MQTVYESIVIWLNSILQNPINSFPSTALVIDLETIPNWTEFQNAGIFSSPNDIATELLAGNVKHTEFKSFYLRMSFGDFQNRLKNETFLEKLRQCIHERNQSGPMPIDGREWVSININAGIYPAQRAENNLWAEYLVPLKLVYVQ